MTKPSKPLITVIILLACIGAVVGFKLLKGSGILDNKVLSAKSKGDPKAKIKITEFIDLQCPACAEGSKYLSELIAAHPKAILLELKYYPLAMHKHALTSSKYAECAARQDKFWPFVDYILEHQKDWSKLIDARPAFNLVAKDVGLNTTQLEACLNDPTVVETIEKNKREGRALDIQSTPTYYINGQMVVGVKSLKEELELLLPSAASSNQQ